MDKTNRIWKWVNTGTAAAVILINALANLIPFGGKTTGEVSAAYPNLFTPAGVTFGIWGVIYALMILFILYQWGLFGKKEQSDLAVQMTGPWFAVSGAMNIAWIAFWHADKIGLSVLFMLGLLASLIVIELRSRKLDNGFRTQIGMKIFFDLYFGWIIAATIANISVYLTAVKWNGFGLSDEFWTVVMLIAGTVIGCVAIIREEKGFTAGAIMWAFTGIVLKHTSATAYNNAYPAVIGAAIIGITVMFTIIIFKFSSFGKDVELEIYPGSYRY